VTSSRPRSENPVPPSPNWKSAGAQVIESRHRRNLFRIAEQTGFDTEAEGCSRRIAATMPAGIKLEIDGKVRRDVFLQDEELRAARCGGEMTIRGSGLKFARAGAVSAPLHGRDVPSSK